MRNDAERLAGLQRIAGLIRDRQQAELARHIQACARTRAQIAGLAAPIPEGSDLPSHVLEDQALRHARWAEPRRIQLNERLALQTVARIAAEGAARAAFGRAMVLDALLAKQRG